MAAELVRRASFASRGLILFDYHSVTWGSEGWEIPHGPRQQNNIAEPEMCHTRLTEPRLWVTQRPPARETTAIGKLLGWNLNPPVTNPLRRCCRRPSKHSLLLCLAGAY
ncbi:hypothetical protein KIL84_020440 [Mauremys mutica]|uniref:Uncharacterized protein n=1 Tax=Mauremys mutica TaxID=74926 RepID=A0A9D3XWR1_9SAUR|nr:hypothetical protein KIL84_020440 [Mauremys mutica]